MKALIILMFLATGNNFYPVRLHTHFNRDREQHQIFIQTERPDQDASENRTHSNTVQPPDLIFLRNHLPGSETCKDQTKKIQYFSGHLLPCEKINLIIPLTRSP